ncbi:protein of unknown function [Paraburkholderia dioscoreae]|uniref:Uncharacterized protein n=1 Tax=Paraburkholderia dioscoreae TaxID=2604047 RepID=A0A5Q4ZSN6_9BURK|nr:protein of unknown function [Paraburkholderia dioscoreae]
MAIAQQLPAHPREQRQRRCSQRAEVAPVREGEPVHEPGQGDVDDQRGEVARAEFHRRSVVSGATMREARDPYRCAYRADPVAQTYRGVYGEVSSPAIACGVRDQEFGHAPHAEKICDHRAHCLPGHSNHYPLLRNVHPSPVPHHPAPVPASAHARRFPR